MTVRPLAVESETVKVRLDVPASGSPAALSFTDSEGSPSSSVIVPVPESSANAAAPGAERLSAKVSSTSSRTSALRVTGTVFVVSPGRKVRSPLVAV